MRTLEQVCRSIISKEESIRCVIGVQSKDIIEDTTNRYDDTLFDFGIRYRIISNGLKLAVHVSIIGWDSIKENATDSLKKVFGVHAVISSAVENNDFDRSSFCRVIKGFDVALVWSIENPFDEMTMSQLSNIRSIVLGTDLSRAFQFLSEKSTGTDYEDSFSIPLQRNIYIAENRKHVFNIIVSSQMDRVTVIIPVPYVDDTERALARLFLQQFQQAQKQSIGKNAPLCMYRRSSDPPRELAISFQSLGLDYEVDAHMNILAGYFSLTFLSIHVDSEDKRLKAIENVLTFTDFIDNHVKMSKSTVNVSLRVYYSKLVEEFENSTL